MTRERRRFYRIPQAFHTRYRLIGELARGWSAANTLNLSAGGMRFRCEESMEVGVLLELQITLPSEGEPLVVRGRIIWCHMPASGVTEAGVEFLELSPDQQAQIDNLVQFLK